MVTQLQSFTLVSYSRETYLSPRESQGVRSMAIEGFALDALPGPGRWIAQSDSSLMRQLIEGSEDALAGLYDRHAQAVFAAALRVSRDRGIAAEVVQETFLTMWNRAELFDPSRGALPAWLLAIARNRAIDRLRAAGRHERAATFSSFGRGEADDSRRSSGSRRRVS